MEKSIKKIIVLMGFFVFAIIVNESSNYLIGVVPPPQLAPVDLFSFLHAFTAAGIVLFAILFTGKELKIKRNIFFMMIFLVIAWEGIENTILKGMPISGGESLLNSGIDIVIGIATSGIMLFREEFKIKSKTNIAAPRSNFS